MELQDKRHSEAIVSFFDQQLRWWTDVYRDDLPRGFFSFEMRRRLELVAGLLTTQISTMDNPEVLECGCGPGDILQLLSSARCQLTGLDLNRRYLELAAARAPGATLREGDIEELPFPDASFDIVYAVGVLQYLSDDQLAAKEIARVTKDGGYVLISVPNYRMLHLLLDPYYVFRLIKNLLGWAEQASNREFDDSKIRRYTLARIRKVFRAYDLHEIRAMSTSYGPLKFWRRELLPLTTSVRISETIRNWSETKLLAGLRHVGNHLIVTLRKGPALPDEGARTHHPPGG